MILYLPILIIVLLSLFVVLHVLPSTDTAWIVIFICGLVAGAGGIVIGGGNWSWPWHRTPPNA